MSMPPADAIVSHSDVASEAGDTDAYDCIKASGLFDPEFYRSTYGKLPPDQDPVQHFLSVGLANGRLPSAHFDPALYRLAIRECGGSNPLLHYLEHNRGVAAPRLEDVLEELIEKFARRRPATIRAPLPSREDLLQHLAYLDHFAAKRTIRFEVDGSNYRIEVPQCDYFYDRLRHDETFAFARLPHGFWDALSIRNRIADDPALAAISPIERRALASRIGSVAQPHLGPFAENFFDEISALISKRGKNQQFFNSVAFKGCPTADEGLFVAKPRPHINLDRLTLFANTFASDEPQFDALYWKRLAFSGDIMALPPLCRTRRVILIGPDYFHDLDRRWELPRFNHVIIPRQSSHRIRWQLLKQIRSFLVNAVAEPGLRPVVLFQCGGSLAYWFISQLFIWNAGVFYIDLGQALNIWFTDVEDMPAHRWMHFYHAAAERRGSAMP